jgi:hypothetical protein
MFVSEHTHAHTRPHHYILAKIITIIDNLTLLEK